MKILNFKLSEPLIVGLIALFIVSTFIIFYKPEFIYTENHQFKKFGTGDPNQNTLFPFWLVITVISISVYVVYYIN